VYEFNVGTMTSFLPFTTSTGCVTCRSRVVASAVSDLPNLRWRRTAHGLFRAGGVTIGCALCLSLDELPSSALAVVRAIEEGVQTWLGRTRRLALCEHCAQLVDTGTALRPDDRLPGVLQPLTTEMNVPSTMTAAN
jgi:hypothetical protein